MEYGAYKYIRLWETETEHPKGVALFEETDRTVK
jgi:hypothetical protein